MEQKKGREVSPQRGVPRITESDETTFSTNVINNQKFGDKSHLRVSDSDTEATRAWGDENET